MVEFKNSKLKTQNSKLEINSSFRERTSLQSKLMIKEGLKQKD